MTATAWIDGCPAPADALRALALTNYGHFTTLQVRGGAAQGLDLHLARLRSATAELFAQDCSAEALRRQLRAALDADGRSDCTLRATVFAPGPEPPRDLAGPGVRMLVAVSAPLRSAAERMRVRTVRYRRALPHLKHVGMFPLIHQRREAVRAGWDDALLVDGQGRVLEGTTWNIGFIERGGGVAWPAGPALPGVTGRLLRQELAGAGTPWRERPVAVDGLAGYRAAFACNARGLRMIGAIDAVAFAPAPELARMLAGALARSPWQPV